jgi:hypothetical protein
VTIRFLTPDILPCIFPPLKEHLYLFPLIPDDPLYFIVREAITPLISLTQTSCYLSITEVVCDLVSHRESSQRLSV